MPKVVLCCVMGLLLALSGCSDKSPREKAAGGEAISLDDTGSRHDKKGDFKKDAPKSDDRSSPRDMGERPERRRPVIDEPRVGMDRPMRERADVQVPAGVLTAGSFDDNLQPHYFRSFAGKVGQNPYLGDLAGKLAGHRLEVRVRNDRGQPVGNARVRVEGIAGRRPVELTTRGDGRVVFLSSWDQLPTEGEIEVAVALTGDSAEVKRRIPAGSGDCPVVLPGAVAQLPRNLDLTIVLDTTASMGDEIQYLKAEVKSIAAAVREQFPQVNQRYGLVLYRDEGDDYVTRVFDFTPNIDEFQKNLAAQSAAGGGDLPEAMHRGLEDATRLRWREADTARVLFLIADAPPHAEHGLRTLEAVNVLRRKGVAVYPVAASCNDPPGTEATEFTMRAMALLTGAQYLFLTDDSGVGGGHGEPRIPHYQVERLNRLMVRMISSELAGRRLDAASQDVLRTVGRPPQSERKE